VNLPQRKDGHTYTFSNAAPTAAIVTFCSWCE
jgi:hypothetical protein